MQTSEKLKNIQEEIVGTRVKLIAVSKRKTTAEIMEAYQAGQRDFGENLVQELVEKEALLPKDIIWHQIGHLQTNKVKQIAPFVGLIHSVDSLKLALEINKQALKNDRIIDCLLQVDIAEEDTKFGLAYDELIDMLRSDDMKKLKNIRIIGLMGIATNSPNEKVIKEEFYELKTLFNGIKESFFKNNSDFKELSMGMSSDYKVALSQGSTMIRVGSLIFGNR